jgi:hypothetical protein
VLQLKETLTEFRGVKLRVAFFDLFDVGEVQALLTQKVRNFVRIVRGAKIYHELASAIFGSVRGVDKLMLCQRSIRLLLQLHTKVAGALSIDPYGPIMLLPRGPMSQT